MLQYNTALKTTTLDWDVAFILNANIHGHSQSVQLYATSATISGTKFGPETHIASPINVVTQVFHYLSTRERHPRGRRLF